MSSQVHLITWSAPEGKLGEGETEESQKENKTYAPAGHITIFNL